MNLEPYFFIWLLAAAVGLLIQFFLIRGAVLSALTAHAHRERMR